jgi:hypothetical protein
MLTEIAQIKRFIAQAHNLPLIDGDSNLMIRVDGEVPDGEHIIPLGASNTPFHVTIKNGAIYIGEKVQ